MVYMTFGIGLMIGPGNCYPTGGLVHLAKLLFNYPTIGCYIIFKVTLSIDLL